jgi:hypothetical protein
MLHLYSDSSPNGFKATIALEELSCLTSCTMCASMKASTVNPPFLR